MSLNRSAASAPLDRRDAAYTTPRPDVFEMVPVGADHVLDVGCSNGALGSSLRAARAGRIVFGIEFDASFASEAKLSLDHVVNADVNFLDWDLALAGTTFDCIIFADVLEHLIDPQGCLQKARRHLRPGGSIVVSLPNIRHLSALWAIFVAGQFPKRDRGIFDRTHLRWFTIADAHQLFSDLGFKVSASNSALRWGDTGGGRVNRLLNRLPGFVQRWGPVREFLTYQMCFRIEMTQ